MHQLAELGEVAAHQGEVVPVVEQTDDTHPKAVASRGDRADDGRVRVCTDNITGADSLVGYKHDWNSTEATANPESSFYGHKMQKIGGGKLGTNQRLVDLNKIQTDSGQKWLAVLDEVEGIAGAAAPPQARADEIALVEAFSTTDGSSRETRPTVSTLRSDVHRVISSSATNNASIATIIAGDGQRRERLPRRLEGHRGHAAREHRDQELPRAGVDLGACQQRAGSGDSCASGEGRWMGGV